MAAKKKFTMLDVVAISQKKCPDLVGQANFERFSTRVPYLDRVVGGSTTRGGVPKGGVVEISGEYSSGKTTTIFSMLRAILDETLPEEGVLILDYEHSMDRHYAMSAFGLSLDNSNPRVRYYDPHTIGDARKILGPIFKASEESGYCPVRAVAIDSIAAMNPDAFLEAALEGEKGKQIGLQAKEIGQFMTEYVGLFEKFGVTLLLANQLRSTIKLSQYDPGPTMDTTGGRALKFYSWVRLVLKPKGDINVKGWDPVTGKRGERPLFKKIQISTIKNKTAPPYLTDELYIRFGSGFDNAMSTVMKGISYGLFHPDAMGSFTQKEDKKVCYIDGDGKKGFTLWRLKIESKENPWVSAVLDKKNSTGRRVVDKEALMTSKTLVDMAEDLKNNKEAWRYLLKEILRHYQQEEQMFLAPGERKDLHDLVLDNEDVIAETAKEATTEPEGCTLAEVMDQVDNIPTTLGPPATGKKKEKPSSG